MSHVTVTGNHEDASDKMDDYIHVALYGSRNQLHQLHVKQSDSASNMVWCDMMCCHVI